MHVHNYWYDNKTLQCQLNIGISDRKQVTVCDFTPILISFTLSF